MQTKLYEELVNNFCQATGFDTPQSLLASGEVLVDDVAISLFYEDTNGGELVLYSDIALRPHEPDPLLLQRLLEANMLWVGTGGATIGMHPETGRIGLATRLAVYKPDGNWLAQVLYRFSVTTQFWREFFEMHKTGTIHSTARH